MGGGGQQSQTTRTQLPPEVSHWANLYLNALGNLVMPGGQIGQSPLPYQEVAPETPQQLQAQALTSAETYGPSPHGWLAPISQMGGAPPTGLMQTMMASPYWRAQVAQNPSDRSAFSTPALSQLAQLYMTGAG